MEEEEKEEKIIKPSNQRRMKPMTKEEFYVFIAALKRYMDVYRGNGIIPFNPDFIRKMFGPLLLDKRLRRSDGDIREAVNLWCSDRAAAEETHGHISHWDVSRVTNMGSLFQFDGGAFNDDISAWDTSNVTDMQYMFCGALAFNKPIGGWDVSKVQSMEYMFSGARAFNQPIGGWDVSKVQNMEDMFFYAGAFNQPIGGWDVSKVQEMGSMFYEARSFNQPIGGWDVSKVQDMGVMFYRCPIEEVNKPVVR
jgi:surface protein